MSLHKVREHFMILEYEQTIGENIALMFHTAWYTKCKDLLHAKLGRKNKLTIPLIVVLEKKFLKYTSYIGSNT